MEISPESYVSVVLFPIVICQATASLKVALLAREIMPNGAYKIPVMELLPVFIAAMPFV